MKKVTPSIISIVLMVFLPLLWKPLLILNPKIIIIIAGLTAVSLTQPPLSVAETNDKKQSDKFSVILILLMSLISGVVPIIDWAYYHSERNNFNLMTMTGIVLIVIGVLFRAWAIRTLGQFFTPTVQIKEEHKLINVGPYRIIRHPSYFAALLSLIGTSVLLESIIGILVSVIAMGTAYYVRIGIEEKKLTEHFGNQYRNYTLQTKKIIPFVF